MKLMELALCVFGGSAKGIYFDTKNGEIENIYAESNVRIIQNAVYIDEKVKYINGYWIYDDGEWRNRTEDVKNRCIEYIRPSFCERAEAFLPKIKNEQVRNELFGTRKVSEEFLAIFDKYINHDILNKYGEHDNFQDFEEVFWIQTARDFCDTHGIKYEDGDYLKFMRLHDLSQCVFYGYGGEVYFEIENHKIKNIFAERHLKHHSDLSHINMKLRYQSRCGTWRSDKGEWRNHTEDVKKRCIKYIRPSFFDVAEKFVPQIKNEQIKNKLLGVPKGSNEFYDLFHEYVYDDLDDNFGEHKNFDKFGEQFWLETARKFCDEHGIKYEE